jgi:hypothetical protein
MTDGLSAQIHKLSPLVSPNPGGLFLWCVIIGNLRKSTSRASGFARRLVRSVYLLERIGHQIVI